MKITKIEQQKNNKDRWSVFIDGNFGFGVTTEEVYKLKLSVGKEIQQEELNLIDAEVNYSKAKNAAINFLSYRARSEKELRDKLISKEYDEIVIERVVQFLKRYKYIDDEQFAKSFVNDRIKLKSTGRKKIVYELKQKGIEAEIIDYVLGNTDLGELTNAIKLIDKKLSRKEEISLKEKQRTYQFLIRKGFTYDIIKKAFEKYLSQNQ